MSVFSALHYSLHNKVEAVIESAFKTYEALTRIMFLVLGFVQQINWALAIDAGLPKNRFGLPASPVFMYIDPGDPVNGTTSYSAAAGSAPSWSYLAFARFWAVIAGMVKALNAFIVNRPHMAVGVALIIGIAIGFAMHFLLSRTASPRPLEIATNSAFDQALTPYYTPPTSPMKSAIPRNFYRRREVPEPEANGSVLLPTSPSIDLNIQEKLDGDRVGLGITAPIAQDAGDLSELEPALDLEIPPTLDSRKVGLGITAAAVDAAIDLGIPETLNTGRIGLGITTCECLYDNTSDNDDEHGAEDVGSAISGSAESSLDGMEDSENSMDEYPSDISCNANDSTRSSVHTDHDLSTEEYPSDVSCISHDAIQESVQAEDDLSFDLNALLFPAAEPGLPNIRLTLPLPSSANDSFELHFEDDGRLMYTSFEEHAPEEGYVDLVPKDEDYLGEMMEAMRRNMETTDYFYDA